MKQSRSVVITSVTPILWNSVRLFFTCGQSAQHCTGVLLLIGSKFVVLCLVLLPICYIEDRSSARRKPMMVDVSTFWFN